ncbi:hypothetical protein B0H15DRAFT_928065, partial [Mycena belliarum]
MHDLQRAVQSAGGASLFSGHSARSEDNMQVCKFCAMLASLTSGADMGSFLLNSKSFNIIQGKNGENTTHRVPANHLFFPEKKPPAGTVRLQVQCNGFRKEFACHRGAAQRRRLHRDDISCSHERDAESERQRFHKQDISSPRKSLHPMPPAGTCRLQVQCDDVWKSLARQRGAAQRRRLRRD